LASEHFARIVEEFFMTELASSRRDGWPEWMLVTAWAFLRVGQVDSLALIDACRNILVVGFDLFGFVFGAVESGDECFLHGFFDLGFIAARLGEATILGSAELFEECWWFRI